MTKTQTLGLGDKEGLLAFTDVSVSSAWNLQMVNASRETSQGLDWDLCLLLMVQCSFYLPHCAPSPAPCLRIHVLLDSKRSI